MNDRWQDEVKVHYAGSREVEYLTQHNRTDAQKAQDEIITKAHEAATAALENVEEALQWLTVVKPSVNATLPHQVRKLIEEVEELRRVRL